jgi:hypothetical protein
VTIASLRNAQRAYERAAEKAERAREQRDAFVRAALEDRIPHKDIMAATGLSRARLAQIKKGTR